MPRELLMNAEFDLSLRPRWRREGALVARAEALRVHGLLAGGPGDSVRLAEPVPGRFIEYLRDKGVEAPRVVLEPELSPGATLTPLGWNRRAAELNREYLQPAPHPPLDVVRRVNSRRFAAELEGELEGRALFRHAVGSLEELEAVLGWAPDRGHGWVVKSDFGNASMGNRRLRQSRLDAVDRRFVASLLAEDDWLVVEPWRPRRLDLSLTFEVATHGGADQLHVHEVVNTAAGAFIGALFTAGPSPVEPWQGAMTAVAEPLARRLAAQGYHGPVCVDALVHAGGLRRLVDLNARQHVSAGALRLWRSWQRAATVYWRFFTASKLRLPADEGAFDRSLGDDAFCPERRRGVLLTSPIRDHAGRRLTKLGLCFAAGSRQEALAMESRFRERFEA